MTDTAAPAALRIDTWADIVCPWCYVGEARLRAAAEDGSTPVELVVHAFELDPSHSHPERVIDMLSRKFGASPEQAAQMDGRVADLARAEGLPYSSDRVTANTFDAHRLIAAAAVDGRGLEVREAIQRGHFDGTVDISDHGALAEAAATAGMARQRALEVLAGEEFADAVRADEAQARELGATGVPFTVVGGRLAIPGCVETTQYAEVIARVAADSAAPPA
ncbi:DsbA family oxidoreductase [Demequina aestuarii]|uniref:DsbA family oxidoreductase n=1 Tax=Demequina aestuarii TaxID=327095 RepID=UPI000782D527|nr:DsbA family oxidoreductase [Demequina aestuarii]